MKKEKLTIGDFAKRLKESRQHTKLTSIAASKIIGVTRQTLSEYESGKSYPTIPTLQKICRAYKVSPNYLICGYDEQINRISVPYQRKLMILLESLMDKDISFDSFNSLVTFKNEELRKDFLYCSAVYKNNSNGLTKIEIIEKILDYINSK